MPRGAGAGFATFVGVGLPSASVPAPEPTFRALGVGAGSNVPKAVERHASEHVLAGRYAALRARRGRDTKLTADRPRGWHFDLAVPRHRRPLPGLRILP